jgi:uncharacterized zinc-type alcohol dehydrogenase-like protein
MPARQPTLPEPTLVRGWAAPERNASLAPFSFERRALRPQDVALDVLLCGVCHTDLHPVGPWGRKFPLVPGHEMWAASPPWGRTSRASRPATWWPSA